MILSSAICAAYPEKAAVTAVVFVISAIFIIIKYRGRDNASELILFCLFASAAAAVNLLAMTFMVGPLQNEFGGKLTEFSGTVISEPITTRQTTTFEVQTDEINGSPRRVKLRVMTSVVPSGGVYSTVSGRAVFYGVTRQRAHSFAHGIFLEANVTPGEGVFITMSPSESSGVRGRFADIRRRVRTEFSKVLSNDEATLCSAMITGSRDQLSPEITAAFNTIGISHLLAVSGLHIAIIAALLLIMTSAIRLPRVKSVIVIIFMILYAALTGMSYSVTRSLLMFMLMEIGTIFYYKTDSLNSIGLAAFIICLDPFAAGDIGMLWSFSCVTLISALSAPITEFLNSRNVLNEKLTPALSVVLCAFIGSLPFFVISSGRISLLTIPANLLIVPAAGVLLCTGALAPILSFIGLHAPAKLLMFVSGAAAKYMIISAKYLARLRGMGTPVDRRFMITLLVIVIITAAAVLIWKGKNTKLSDMAVLPLLMAALYSLAFACFPRTVLSVLDVGNGMTAVLKNGDSAYVLCSFGQSGQYPTISQELRRSGSVAALVDVRTDNSYNYGRRIVGDFDPAVIIVRGERQRDYAWSRYCGAGVDTADDHKIMVIDDDTYVDMYFTDDMVCEMIYAGDDRVLVCYGEGEIPDAMRSPNIAVICDTSVLPQLSDDTEVILSSCTIDEGSSEIYAATCGAGRIDITFGSGGYEYSREYTGGVITYAGSNRE